MTPLQIPAEHPVFDCERRMVAAQLASDVNELEALLNDQLCFTDLTGGMGRKLDDLALHRSGRFRITRMELVEREARALEGGVVVVSLMNAAATIDGAAVEKMIRYTRVWRAADDGYRLTVAHLSEAARPA